MVFGDMPRFIERSELVEHHIVSYSFGDADALYLRGQWTVHQNLPNVNAIWMGCDHLGRGLQSEILQKVAWVRRNEAAGRTSYHKRFVSAEGCYSHRAMLTKGIKVKVAHKQFAGLELKESARGAVYLIHGALWYCDAPAPPSGGDFGHVGATAEPLLAEMAAASDLDCDTSLPGVHVPVGEPSIVPTSAEGCGAWVPPEHRLCGAPACRRRASPHHAPHRQALPPAPLPSCPSAAKTPLRALPAPCLHGCSDAPVVTAQVGAPG